MKICRTLVTILIAVSMLATFTACSTDNGENDRDVHIQQQSENAAPTDSEESNRVSDDKAEIKVERDVDSIAEYLGLTGGSETLYSFIGATAGKEFNGGDVELYQFDVDSPAYAQVIGDNSPLKISAYKDGFVLLFPASVEADQTIIDAFNAIVFK